MQDVKDFVEGIVIGIVLTLVIVGVYLCKMNFQLSEGHYADLERQIEELRSK